MFYFVWFSLGVVLAIALLRFANRLKLHSMKHLLGLSLILASMIYIGFAVVWGSSAWVAMEALGVLIYSLFYWLSMKYSAIWLSLGWLLHPVWDVVLHLFGPGSHVAPEWYAVACLSFDIVVAAYIFHRVKYRTKDA